MKRFVGAWTMLSLLPAAAALASGADDATLRKALDEIESLRRQNESLASQNAEIAARVRTLEDRAVAAQDGWLTEARAREIREIVGDVLADSAARASLAGDGAAAGYDKSKGFFIASADGNYSLSVKGDAQFRWAYDSRKIGSATAAQGSPSNKTAGDAWGFEMRRVRLTFFGNVVDPSWSYEVKIAFNRSASAGNNGFVDEAFVTKDFGGGWTLRAGQFKAPFLREELVSSTTQLAVERTLVSDVFYGEVQPGRAGRVRRSRGRAVAGAGLLRRRPPRERDGRSFDGDHGRRRLRGCSHHALQQQRDELGLRRTLRVPFGAGNWRAIATSSSSRT